MRRNDPRYNQYIKRRLLSLEKKRLMRIKHKNHHIPLGNNYPEAENTKEIYPSIVPEVFSLIDNTTETIDYFNNLINNVLRSRNTERVFFQFKKVKQISIDALMYLLAILKFAKGNIKEFYGNIPQETAPKEVFIKSGFLKKITNSNISVCECTESCFMCFGKQASIKDSSDVCKFLHKHSSATKKDTWFLYDILMELEVNTDEHAYKKNANPIFDPNWIISVEDIGDVFRFTFLDVGVGICKTVYKRWHEVVNIGTTHVEYLSSAFNGVLRSETKNSYRGKGLPKIKKYADQHLIKNLRVVANKAMCFFDEKQSKVYGKSLSTALSGSIYYWEIPKSQFEKKEIRIA